ncbi:urea transport system permease protein [Lipingzhangella halophila]|uniref:Urea transport system permease protein n=1 Tax=Lipingzhangella halophila TaxID=1783352 RepID=A0A7W7RN26_9ACTN|nr:urea ABC transporter permease subunit UrtC [Lipingzhangella halophila]MBB4935005.1 urea transport system permease protein [Lipingzhangella halophila]
MTADDTRATARPAPAVATDPQPSLLARLRGPLVVAALVAAALLVLPLFLDQFRLNLFAQYLCYAIVAIGIALAWGRGGMLTLGHGVYFGLGGYALAMHLTLARIAEDPMAPGGLPDFMEWSGLETLPLLWRPFAHPAFALAAVVAVPGAVAALLGWAVFRQRVRGAYFAILNQALAAAFVILIIGQQHLTGGTNGLTDFPTFAGTDLYSPEAQWVVFVIVVITTALIYLLFRHVAGSRYGALLVAVRDGEDRVRFLGYNPTWIKTFAYTLSAMAAGIAGALFVPVMGIISPEMLGVVPSIMFVLAVAIGGRYSLAGAAVGAVVMNAAQTTFSENFANGWLYLQGVLFVVVIAFAPRGLAGIAQSIAATVQRSWRARATGGAAGSAAGAPQETDASGSPR